MTASRTQTPDPDLLNLLQQEMMEELRDHILPFWIKLGVDSDHGGFLGRINGDNKQVAKADKSVILNARLLWTFSAAYRLIGDDTYLIHAEKAYNYMESHFYDREFGGFFWSLDHMGNPLSMKKHVYAQAFAIYGYSEFARATGTKRAVDKAEETYHLIEKVAHNERYGGYHEAFSRDWKKIDDVRLSKNDADQPRSMNTHLHVMEAYANLYRVTGDHELADRLSDVTELMMNVVFDDEINHFHTFFDEEWQPKSEFYSYGHDIEAAWLLMDSASTLNDHSLRSKAADLARQVGYETLKEGIDEKTGGVYNTGANGKPLDDDYHWWVQAEAIVGFLYAYEVTQDEGFIESAFKIWEFIKEYVKDNACGEWFFRLDRDGQPYNDEDKAGPWKCPYHNSRACLILYERVKLSGEAAVHASKENSR